MDTTKLKTSTVLISQRQLDHTEHVPRFHFKRTPQRGNVVRLRPSAVFDDALVYGNVWFYSLRRLRPESCLSLWFLLVRLFFYPFFCFSGFDEHYILIIALILCVCVFPNTEAMHPSCESYSILLIPCNHNYCLSLLVSILKRQTTRFYFLLISSCRPIFVRIVD